LCFFIKFLTFKGQGKSVSQFLTHVVWHAPNKQTNAPPKQANQPWHHQTQPWLLRMGSLGSRSVSWGQHWPYHGGRGQRCCGAGRQRLMLVVVCFCVVAVICLLAINDTYFVYFVESWYRIGQNDQFLRTHNKKCTKQHPNYKTASK
jgi:hypothetical protein